MIEYDRKLKERARSLRTQMTDSERTLRARFRRKQVRAVQDLQRDAFLASQGLRVLRFDDLQVLMEIEGVMEVIVQAVSGSLERNPP